MENLRIRTATARAALCILALLLALFLLWTLPSWLTESPRLTGIDKHTAANNARTGVVAFIAVLGALGSLIFTGQAYRLAWRGHVTERYAKAVEQLGSDAMSVRIGGIYALERVSHESPDDQPTIVEVLAAFVRDRSPWPPAARLGQASRRRWLRRRDFPSAEPGTQAPPSDALAVLAVLRRRERHTGERPIDLRATNLSGVDLHDADLTGARLERANLTNATLNGAILQEAHLNGAVLSGANLWATGLAYAIMDGRHQLTEQQLDVANHVGEIQWLEDEPVDSSKARRP